MFSMISAMLSPEESSFNRGISRHGSISSDIQGKVE
jgi:hypothetical protein